MTVVSIIFFVVSGNATAEKRIDLYSDSQLVLDQSQRLRRLAINKGLANIVVKVSGQQQVLQHPVIKDALTQANRYLLRYSYESTDETLPLAGEQRPARRLRLFFSPTSVQRLLATADIPIWFESRPEILFWLVNDQRGQRTLDTESAVMKAFESAADKRGLPIVLPLLDLNDRQQLSASRLWVMDEASIATASERYNADSVLAGRVIESSGQWSGRFLVLHHQQTEYFTANASTLQDLAHAIIAEITAYHASLEAVIVKDEGVAPSMTIAIENIQSFEQYADLLTLLEELPIIAGMMLSQISTNTVTIELRYNGTSDKVLSTLANIPLLEESINPYSSDVGNEANIDARYLWR